jgi:hypothetical protein
MNRFKSRQNERRGSSGAADQSGPAMRELKPLQDLTAYVQEYAKQRPESVALACVGVGFILGWKLKLW